MPKKPRKDDKKAEKKRKEEEKKRKEEEKKKKKAAKDSEKKGKNTPASPEPATPKSSEAGDGDSEEEEEEDLMGDQSWAKTEDFSGALDDMFGAMMGDMEQMKAEAQAAGVDLNVKMGSMGEDAAAAEAEEERKAAQQAAADVEQAEKDRLAKERAEKRKNMSKEDKMAKMKCKSLQKTAAEMKSAGTLVDVARYEAALQLLEDEDWVQAEQALKDATSVADGSSAAAASNGTARPEPEPEPEPEPAQTLTAELSAAVAQVQAVLESHASETAFKQAVALLKAAIEADKTVGRRQEAALMYLAAANAIAAVNADPGAAAKQKEALEKKLAAMDARIATALKDSRTLFAEIDEDNSGTIEPAEFAILMEKMQQEVQDGQFAAIDADGSGRIEYEEFVVFLAEQGMQQNAQAFAAGWRAVQGDESLAFVEELERMALAEAVVAAKKCTAELEGGRAAAEKKRAAVQAAQAEAAAAEAAKAAEEEAAAAKAAAAEQAQADAKAAEERAAREAEEEAAAAAAAKAAEEEAAAAAAAKAAEEEAAAAAAAAKAAEEEAAAAAAAKAAEEEAAAAAAAKAAEEEAATAAAAKAAEEEAAAAAAAKAAEEEAAAKAAEEEAAAAVAAKAAESETAAAAAAKEKPAAASAPKAAEEEVAVPAPAVKATALKSIAKDLPVMYCKKCKRTGPNPGTCSCPIFMKTTQVPDVGAELPETAISGTDGATSVEPAWQQERREREAAERERREREAKEREVRDEEDRRAAAELKAREDERARRAAQERRKAAEAIARESERIEQRIAEETKRRADAEVARRVAEATQEKLRAEEARRQAAAIMAMPKEDRKRHAEAKVLKQQERRAVASAGEQFDEEARWRQEQEEHGRRLFAIADGQHHGGVEAGNSARLLGLPPGYSIIGPSVPLEERRAGMHTRSQALLGKLGVRGVRARPGATVNQPVGEYLREQLDARRPDGTAGAALAQGLTMLDAIRPDDPLGWLCDYLRDPTSEKWADQASVARQQRAAAMAISGRVREEVGSVEYLGRLRPHLHAALRTLVDDRPKNAAMTLSDFLGSNREAASSGNADAETAETAETAGEDGTRAGANDDEVVE